jgi:hypothetical protein
MPILLSSAELRVVHPDLIPHVAHPGNVFHDVLGHSLFMPILNRTAQGHFTVIYLDLDLGGVDLRMVGQPFIDIFANTIV